MFCLTFRQARMTGGQALRQVRRTARHAPRTDGDTYAAAIGLVEIRDAFIEIHIPLPSTSHQLLAMANGIRWTGANANLTTDAEFVCAKIIGLISDERQIRCHCR